MSRVPTYADEVIRKLEVVTDAAGQWSKMREGRDVYVSLDLLHEAIKALHQTGSALEKLTQQVCWMNGQMGRAATEATSALANSQTPEAGAGYGTASAPRPNVTDPGMNNPSNVEKQA